MRIKSLFICTFIASFVLILSVFVTPVIAASKCDSISNPELKVSCLEKVLNDLRGKEVTLQNEISCMDGQISLTQYKIQNSIANIQKTEQKIQKLAGDISDLAQRIDKLEKSIDHQKGVLGSRMRERYKEKDDSFLMILFGSDTLNQLVKKSEYLKVMEINDDKMIKDMDKSKRNFEEQKRLFQESKQEQETLKRQLEVEKANLDSYRASLEDQKNVKEALLEQTQNDETKFQKRLEDARKELLQITRAVAVLKNEKSKDVKAGDAIGIQGNTGYSFGDHVHFGVYKYSSFKDIEGWDWYYSNYVDPAKKLEKKTVYWNTGCSSATNKTLGEGSWRWPLSSPTISQGFGYTCWSSIYYGGKVHPAYDMHGKVGSIVYAVADGKAYFCRNCMGDGGNGVFIFHGGGYMTVYWHLR